MWDTNIVPIMRPRVVDLPNLRPMHNHALYSVSLTIACLLTFFQNQSSSRQLLQYVDEAGVTAATPAPAAAAGLLLEA